MNMEKGDAGNKRVLDVESIQKKLIESYKYTEKAKDRDLVLVIGNTGVGKSTTCNYLLGHEMREGKHNRRPVIETVHETDIKIGHYVNAETLYAKTIMMDDASLLHCEGSDSCICLLDCPGFLGNKTIEDRVIESISTELAIRNAYQIKGILILISFNSLLETKVLELRELVKTLISLFKDPIEMVQYSIFIVTKKFNFMPDEEARDITIGALHSVKEFSEGQAKLLEENRSLNSSEGLSYTDYDKIATYFSAVLERCKDIIIINALDNGESRKLVIDQINGIRPRKGFMKRITQAGISFMKYTVGFKNDENKKICPVTVNDFNFSKYDNYRIEFNKTVYDCAHDGNVLIDNIQQYEENTSRICSDIAYNETRLSTLKKLVPDLIEDIRKVEENRSQKLKIDFVSIKNLELMIEENKKQIVLKKKQMEQNTILQKKLSEELSSINNNDPLEFVQSVLYKDVGWWRFFGWEEMKLDANTGDESIPIIKINSDLENGIWTDEVDERDKGIYKITYKSNYRARPARASVMTYIKTKDEAGNKMRIKEINNHLSKLKEDQIQLKSEIDDMESKNNSLQSTIELAHRNKEDYKNSLKQKLKEYEEKLKHHRCLVIRNQQDKMEKMSSGLIAIQDFYKNRCKFDIIVSISALLEFPSSIVKQFVTRYNEFLSDIDTYEQIFKESTINSDSFLSTKKAEKIIDLKDPITGDEIKDLVVTSHVGTAFDEHSLLKQFNTNASTLPFVFKHKDGSLEEIEYLHWHKIPVIENYIEDQRNHRIGPQSFTSSMSFISTSELNQMTLNDLKKQKDVLEQDICNMKEKLGVKETALDKMCRHIEKLELEIQSKQPFIGQ